MCLCRAVNCSLNKPFRPLGDVGTAIADVRQVCGKRHPLSTALLLLKVHRRTTLSKVEASTFGARPDPCILY